MSGEILPRNLGTDLAKAAVVVGGLYLALKIFAPSPGNSGLSLAQLRQRAAAARAAQTAPFYPGTPVPNPAAIANDVVGATGQLLTQAGTDVLGGAKYVEKTIAGLL